MIYTNLLIWTKAFIFLRDPVICTIQLCEINAFLFLQDPVTCIILLYQTKLFLSWQVPFVHSFFFLFACISSFLRDLCLAITLCLSGFEKLVEQHINLIRYSTSLLWIFFYIISTNDWIRKSVSFFFSNISSVQLGLNLII